MRNYVETRDLRWVNLQFTDLAGFLRQVTVRVNPRSESLDELISKLDGSSVKGFTGVEESDLLLKPDINTFAKLPWSDGFGRLICGVYVNNERFTKDPRYVAEKLDNILASTNLSPFVSAELEFFVFDKVSVEVSPWRQLFEVSSSEAPWGSLPFANRIKEGYYVAYPKDKFVSLKTELAETLINYFGLAVEALHHEVAAASQHEISFRGGSLTYVSDSIQTVKYVARVLASLKGYTATFMPKPIHGDNGNGMHVHISLWRGNENLFYDPNDDYACLSQEARYFIGGLIEHGRALSAIVSPTTNSYRRLVPGYEAPTYLAWGAGNRSVAIRIPIYERCSRFVRIEYRPPDPSANPYLATTAIMLAGLDGIKKKLEPGEPVKDNLYEASIKHNDIKNLPESLDEALDELESDNEWLSHVFPKELLEAYIEMKREESRTLRSYPTPAEFYYYLDL
ncbi:MAG: type I glutamate--ammonia ligase [Zestosphaera sp.]